jgi:subtilisin family serine protease
MVMPAFVALACMLALAAPGGVAAPLQGAAPVAAPADADVVRGRVLVKLVPGATIAFGTDGAPTARRGDGRADGRVARALATAGARAVGAALAVAPRDLVRARAAGLDRWVELSIDDGADPRAVAATLAAAGGIVERAEPIGIGGIASDAPAPNDPLYPQQHALENTGQLVGGVAGEAGSDIRARGAWHLSVGRADTIVATLDSGVDPHEAFADRMVPGWNVPAGNADTASQCAQHGTHVAGIVAARGNDAQGVAGVAWNVKLMPVTVLSGCSGTTAWLAAGIIWAVDHGATVLNASLQYSVENQVLRDAIAYAMADGAIVVAAAGNTGTNGVAVPARWPEVVAVGSIDSMGTPASNTAVGPQLDLAAPGVSILSTIEPGAYGLKSGTSMAAPFVSGTFALMRAAAPTIAARDLAPIVIETAVDISTPGFDNRTGHGRLDAAAAVREARRRAGLGDLNGDAAIDGNDLGLLLAAWGPCSIACAADLTDDGTVNGDDLGVMLGNWGPAN